MRTCGDGLLRAGRGGGNRSAGADGLLEGRAAATSDRLRRPLVSDTQESLVGATLAALRASRGEPASNFIEQVGGWQRIADGVAGAVDDPVSVPLIRLVVRDAPTGGADATAALSAVVAAVLAMRSAAGFGDCVEALVTSPAVLDAVADRLTDGLLSQVVAFASLTDPTSAEVDRAATALEGVTRLRVGGYGSHFSFLGALERFRTPVPRRLAAAIVRSVGTAIDHWPEASSLVGVVMAVAGMTAPFGTPVTGADPKDVASDASWVLANIELAEALRAETSEDMVNRLQVSLGHLRLGADTYDRDDAKILARVLEIVAAMMSRDGEPSIEGIRAALPSREMVEDLVEQQVNLNLALSGLDHWYADVKRQTTAAWVAIVEDLEYARAQFAEDGFYRPEAIIDDLLTIYQATRSVEVVRRDDDFGAFLAIVQPVIESGFASKAAFISNLDHYTRDLAMRVDAVDEEQRPQLTAALKLATQVLDGARAVIARGTPPGKPDGGTSSGSLPRELRKLFGEGTPEAAKLAALGDEMLRKLVSSVEDKGASRRVSLMEDEVLRKIRGGLAASPDYTGEVKDAVDEVLLQVVRFVGNRQNVQADRKPYLFDPAADEHALHEDLIDFLYSALGPTVEMEIPNVGGGRVDIRVKYSTFSIYLELKVDATKKTLSDKRAYLNQAATYQATDVRIGFLVALRTKAFPTGGAHPHLVSLFEHATVDVPGDDAPRHLVLIDVPGSRTSPSNKEAL